MKHSTRLLAAALTLCLLPACDQDLGSDWDMVVDPAVDSPWDPGVDVSMEPAADPAVDAPAETAADTAPEIPPAGDPSFGSDATITDVREMADIINECREGYVSHDRFWGVPMGTGEFHTTVTWPIVLTWSDDAAAVAQVEADAIAGGATPPGHDVVSAGYFWVDGVNSSPYMVTTDEYHMRTANTFSRMSICYHDFGGHGPVLTQLGLGASAGTDGSTVWVLVLIE